MSFKSGDIVTVDFPGVNGIKRLSERDWKGVRLCVKVALAELEDSIDTT